MKKHLILAGMATLMAACSSEGKSPSTTKDWGTGLNTIERHYNKPAPETYTAAVAALKSFKLNINSDLHDEMGGVLSGSRADGQKITVNVSIMDKANSVAVVRVEPGNSTLATMIHEKIADKLGMGTANAAFLGGNTEDFPYSADLQGGTDAAERTVKALGWTVTNKEVKETWVQLDARAEDSHPARIRMERVTDHGFTLKVKFTAGNGNTDVSKAMIGRLHEEFDRQIGGHVQ